MHPNHTTKICSKCRQDLPLDHFGKNRSEADGLQRWCRACRKAHADAPERKAKKVEYDRYYRADDLAAWQAQQPHADPRLKHCPKCGEVRPRSDFGPNRARHDGLQTYCKACMRAIDKKRNTKRAPAQARAKRERYAPIKAENAAKQAAYKTELLAVAVKVCRCCRQERLKTEYTIDARYADGCYPWCAACRREWRRGHNEHRRALNRAWRTRHQEHVRERARRVYPKYRDKAAPRRRAYDQWRYKNNPAVRARKNQQAAEKNRRRKASLYGAPGGHHTEQEWQDLLTKYNHCCLWCGCKGKLSRDHIIPVTLQGPDTIDNIQPLCKVCNSRKNNRVMDFRPPE